MGTSIHEGLRFPWIQGRSVFTLAEELRGVMRDATRLVSIQENGTELVDLLTQANESNPRITTYKDLRRHLLLSDKIEEIDLTFLLVEPKHRRYLIGFPMGDMTAVDLAHAKALTLPAVTRWGYHDGERPDDVAEHDWATRRKDWNTVGYGPAIQYGITVQLPKADLTPRTLSLTYTEKDWELVGLNAFRDPSRLAVRAVMNQLWLTASTELGEKFSEVLAGNMLGALMDVKDLASTLLTQRPEIATVPEYDPTLLRTDTPVERVKTHITQDEQSRANELILSSE